MPIFGEPQSTSYFSAPSETLDPTLFEGRAIRSWVRQGIVTLLNDFLSRYYRHPELWSHPWLAGSGVSYQWSAQRSPGDLDCLVGVDYTQFRKANPEFAGLSDREISEQINEGFRSDLQPGTEDWNGYELTFYVNPGATDIRAIKPYAAYDLKYNEWTVTPDPNAHAPENSLWEQSVTSDRHLANQIALRFIAASQELEMSNNGAARRNAETRVAQATRQGGALYDEIHGNRTLAFSTGGDGYNDFHNYRWQAGKREGTIQTLRNIRDHASALVEDDSYGVELPDANTLVRRAALYRNTL
jgi:hypothetical protein